MVKIMQLCSIEKNPFKLILLHEGLIYLQKLILHKLANKNSGKQNKLLKYPKAYLMAKMIKVFQGN